MLLWTLVNDSTYLNLVYLATSLILLPYLWSAGYQVLLAARGETYENGTGRTRDLLIGLVGLGYAVWLVYAGGWQYLLIAALFYLVGTVFFVWARRESTLPVFTGAEWVGRGRGGGDLGGRGRHAGQRHRCQCCDRLPAT